MHRNTKEGIELWMDRGKTSTYTFEVMRYSSLGSMCHRDEDLFIRYGGVIEWWWQEKVWYKLYYGIGLSSM